MKFSEAIPKFIAWKQYDTKQGTAYTYSMTIRQFGLFMRNPDIEAVRYDDVIVYLDTMKVLGWDNNSYQSKCIALRKFFEFFKKQGMKVLDHHLIPLPDREYKFPKSVDEADYRKLLAAIPKRPQPQNHRNRAMIMMLHDCGMRIGELVALNENQVDTVEMKAVIKTEKAKHIKPIRKIMWTEETNEVLKQWLAKKESIKSAGERPLFVTVLSGKSGKRLDRRIIEEMLRRLSIKAKLGFNCNPHRFRHSFGRDLGKKGANNSIISTLLGHTTLESSYVYTILDDKMMEEQYTKYRR